MPRSLTTLVTLLLGGTFPLNAAAQDRGAPLAMDQLPCNFCHTCEKPTLSYLCLRPCPRTSAAAVARRMSRMHGPDVVILKELEDLYLPVPFDHKGHARMAEMTDGCALCHHYTPEGAAQPACKNCHEATLRPEDLTTPSTKPSLKAAYHRQCMSCHREWSGGTACTACHAPKTGQNQPLPTVKDLLDGMHDPVKAPHREIYELESNPAVGAKVVFRHKEHVQAFGLKCAECHREESCSRCHEELQEDEQRPKTHSEHHAPCSFCHNVDDRTACGRCHWNEGDRMPKSFDHADTGWPLSKHHVKVACRTCHRNPPFAKLNRACDTCHSDWEPDTFDHAVTGQILNNDHEEIDCADCHAERKFDSPPKCDECHEEDEGITFPAKRPGPVVIPSHRVSDQPSKD